MIFGAKIEDRSKGKEIELDQAQQREKAKFCVVHGMEMFHT